jgi:hypothetical protein
MSQKIYGGIIMFNKSRLLATFLGVFILAGVQNLYSQTEYPPEMEKKLDQVIDLVRSEIKKERISFLGKFMSFSSDEATVFWPIYKEYEAEYDKLGDKRVDLIKEYDKYFLSMDSAKATELANTAIELKESRLALLKKYHGKISGALNPIIAARFLQVENYIQAAIDIQLAAGLPLIQEKK